MIKKQTITSKTQFLSYPVGDFLIRVKNASMSGVREVTASNTKLIRAVSKVLKEEGYLEDIEIKDGQIFVQLKFRNKRPILMDLKLVSRPGLRRYVSASALNDFKGPENYILTTSKGVMSSQDARKQNLGGEIIVSIL